MNYNLQKAPSRCLHETIVLEMSHRFMKNFNYLIVDPINQLAVIVDPAWEIEKIEHALDESGVTLAGILITHSHPDHIHLAKPLAKQYSCPIWMSQEEIDASGFTDQHLIGINEDEFFVGNILIQPIKTPGHTEGCVCYLIGDGLYTGDVLFAEGCGMCPSLEASDQMFESLQLLKSRISHSTRIYPGHSYGKYPGQLFSNVLKENIYLQFSTRDTFTSFRMRRNQSKIKMFDFQ